jgi:CRP-like cAMP-binding protein
MQSEVSPHDIETPPLPDGGNLPRQAVLLSIEGVLAFDLFSDCRDEMRKELTKRYMKEMKSAAYLGIPWEKQPPVWLRRFKKGEVICEEGDFDQTGFYILKGRVKIFITAQHGLLRSHERKGEALISLFRRYATQFVTSLAEAMEDPNTRNSIPTDAPVDLDLENPVAVLSAGDFFGEMSCINNYPRSATVVALEECECLEMLAPVLRLLKEKSSHFKEDYRRRALANHLGNVPAFAGYVGEIHEFLKDRIEFIDKSPPFKPGEEVLFREGDEPDGFYLIRNGHVKVTKAVPGGEVVLAYMARGEYLGETGLLEGIPRTATCAALDTVELVRVKPEDFQVLVERFPSVKTRLREKSAERQAATQMWVERQAAYVLDDFLGKGLMDAQNLLLLDLEKCTRCDECVRACADAHDGVTRLNRVGERFDKYLVATSCRSCSDPLCMTECPVGAIRRRENLEIVIEPWCIGCTKCAQNCPYGNINMQEVSPIQLEVDEGAKKAAVVRQKAVACDLCSNISGGPRCVYACPHDAAHRVRREEFPDYFPNLYTREGMQSRAVPLAKES